MEIDLKALNLGAEKEQEVRDSLAPLLRELEINFSSPKGFDIADAKITLDVIVEEVPIRLFIPFNLKSVIGEPNETHNRQQGIAGSDAAAHRLT